MTAIDNPQIGKFYQVPAVYTVSWYGSFTGWVPIIGPRHEDAEILNFHYQHYHVDWRFVGKKIWSTATWYRGPSSCFALVVMVVDKLGRPVVTKGPELRRMRCKRDFPDFPRGAAMRAWMPELERAYGRKRLKNMVCPHRGIDLSGLPAVDGIVTCPGHGLRWDIKTGKLSTCIVTAPPVI